MSYVTITSITPTSVSISWEGFSSSYRLYYKSLYQSDYDTLFTTADTITIRGLESDRPYEVRVEAMCENNSTSLLSAPLEFVTIQYPAQVPYYCSFEPNETETYEWEIVNGNSVNRWIIDTMAHRFGEYGLYISNNDSSNTYSIDSPLDTEVPEDAAAAIDALFASPLMIGTCFISTPGIVTASFSNKSGRTFKLEIAIRIAS